MMVQIILYYTIMDKSDETITWPVQTFLYLPVVLREWLGKGHIEFKIRKFPFQFPKMIQIDQPSFGTTAIPIRNLTVGLKGLKQMIQVRPHRGHSRPTADIEHFGIGFIDKKFPVRPGDNDFIPRFLSKDI